MSRIIKTAKLIRRNWKKSTFLFGVLTYGTSYFVEKYRTFEMMRAYCEEAKKYGEKTVHQTMKPKHVTVILNPEANYKKSNIQFEKFAAPLLHLAGIKVSLFLTEKEKQALELMQIMSNTDAVIIAGGDGTVQEAITGLLRRPGYEEESLPIGIIPLGKTNTVAQYLFGSKSSSHAQLMAEAAMSVIRETTTNLDVLKVQFADDSTVYGMCNFEQGLFGDIEPLVDKYWYLGFLKDKYAYFRNSSKNWEPIVNNGLEYVAPCSGCSKCYLPPKKKGISQLPSRWWQVFVPRTTDHRVSSGVPEANDLKAKVINEDCGKRISLPPGYSNISVSTSAVEQESSAKPGVLYIKIFPENLSKTEIISSGLSHRKSKLQDDSSLATIVEARQLIIKSAESTKDSYKDTSAYDDSYDQVSSEHMQTIPSIASTSVEITSPDQSRSSSLLNNSTSSESKEPNSAVLLDSLKEESSEQVSVLSRNPHETLVSPDSTNKESINQSENASSLLTGRIEAADNLDSKVSTTTSIEKPIKEHQNEAFSYIDKEKYKRSSCIISILPKKVTVYA